MPGVPARRERAGIASAPTDEGFVEFTVKCYPAGVASSALHACEEGDRLGLRGPYGNSFPLEEMEGSDIVIVASRQTG